MSRFAHEASKRIVDFALSHGLNTIIIGKNKGQKQRSRMNKQNNQNFIGIPHQVMINLIKYKANLAGIVVIQHSEAYTSQTSFLDWEEPIRANGDQARKRKGLSPAKRRLKRGLYRADTDTRSRVRRRKRRLTNHQKSSPECVCGRDSGHRIMSSQMVLAILGSTISKRFRKKFNCRTDRKVVPEKVVTRRWTLALSVDGLIKVGCEQGLPKP